MLKWLLILAFGGLVVGGLAWSGNKLEAGDAAPPFEMAGSDGKTYRLSDFVGRKAVVIAWFPKAFTGG